jgi:hypothetical protein
MKIDLYNILSDPDFPNHWPLSSIYRFKSIKNRIFSKCVNIYPEQYELTKVINKITRESLSKDNKNKISPRTLNTYRSVLLKFIAEKITNKQLKPWQASNFFKRSKYLNNDRS